MLRIVPVVLVIMVTVFALVDCAQTPDETIRNMPKPLWLMVILIANIAGSIAWLIAGRPKQQGGWPRPPHGFGPRGPRRPGPRGPDDDPDFLRNL